MMIKKLFLFDLDWTVIYTGGAGIHALNHAFKTHYNIPEAMKGITPDGKTDPAIIREMIKVHLKRDAQTGEIEALCKSYVANLPEVVEKSTGYRILPGIPELLETLSRRKDVLMGLGTGNLEGGAQAKLARAGLMRYFKFGGYANDSEIRPELLQAGVRRGEALAGHPIPPRDVIVIGDNFRDVTAGQAIGAVTVAVASGPMSFEELAAHHPDFLFRDLSDTAKVLELLLDPAPQH